MFLRAVAFISMACSLLLIATFSSAAETRGLSVVAKDKSTGRNEEVKLYHKSYAVIIGIDRYRNLAADRQLKNAVIDAKGIEATLRKLYRFERVYTLYDHDATRDGITRLLTSELPKKMGKEDSLFVFWAGHGNQEKTHDGELGYLIPHDGNAAGIYGNITMSQLKDDISRAIPAKHIFYAFDACYSGLLTSRSVDKKVSHDISYLRSITSERVRQVLTAGSKGQEALDGGPRGHSVFTGRLIEALEARGDYITANEIQQQLKEKVYHDARARGHEQTPGYGTLYGTGDYVFVPQEQKIEDGSAELERIIRERKAQEKMVAEMNKSRVADQQRRARQKDPETQFWGEVKTSGAGEYLEAYLKQYPKGKYVDLARIELKRIDERKKSEEARDKGEQNHKAKTSRPPSSQGRRLALVIGNNDYQKVSKLEKAGNDATAMARELKAAGFEVQQYLDLNYESMVKAVEVFLNRIDFGDQVVVYFAGHGVQIKTGGYLLPIDIEAGSERQVEKTAYGLADLTDRLSEAKVSFALVMVDACRDNPLKAKGRIVGNTRGLSAIEPPKGQMVVYSASKGQVALDRLSDEDKDPSSIFVRVFIAKMKKPGVRIEEMMREVQDAVDKLAQSVDHEQRPAIYNESRGNFYFYAP